MGGAIDQDLLNKVVSNRIETEFEHSSGIGFHSKQNWPNQSVSLREIF